MKAVILAGGSGTRLWPLSTKSQPKQFQTLISDKTLFQETLERLHFLSKKDIFIATNRTYADIVKKQAPEIPEENIIIEPALRDTASCIGLACAIIGKKYPNEVLSVIYADHLIREPKEFIKKLKIAEKLALTDHTLNIILVKASSPNPHLGYVKRGKTLKEIDNTEIFQFEKFIEKPSKKVAETFVQSYKYLWNTGYFVWRITDILKEYKKHLPDTWKKLHLIQNAIGTPSEKEILEKIYPSLEKISIDYAIMEKVDPARVRIIAADIGWSDIGNYEALFNEIAKNDTENITKGKSVNIDTKGSIIYNFDTKMVTTLGLKDMIVINTKNSIFISKKSESKNIKKLIQELKKTHPGIL